MALGMISAGLGIAKGLFGGFGARKRERAAARQRQAAESKMRSLEASRQDITNLFQSQAGRITNPYANLGVATQAAEMQAQQTDLSLASSLDTLRATGTGGGGATALAQAALSAKQGVAASIEAQEAKNIAARAAGEQSMQAAQIAEIARSQRGEDLAFQRREAREVTQLDRTQGAIDQARQRQEAAGAAKRAAFGSALGSLGSFAGAGLSNMQAGKKFFGGGLADTVKSGIDKEGLLKALQGGSDNASLNTGVQA